MDIRVSIEDLRSLFQDASFIGDACPVITGVASVEEATPNDATFVAGAKFVGKLGQTRAGVVFAPLGTVAVPSDGQIFVLVKDPSLAMAKLCETIELQTRPKPAPGVHPSACVDPSAQISHSASVGPMCCIGAGSTIGDNVVLEARVYIGRKVAVGADSYLFPGVIVEDNCKIGCRVRLQPGVMIGGDGFGYIQVGSLPDIVHYKVPQLGNVVIEDDVEIGANSTVDRARLGQTRIGQGTKIDNLVHIAHNVKIGRGCIICALSGLSGSSTLGDYVVMWGQSATVGHVNIGSYSVIGGQAGVTKDLPEGSKVTGSPARSMFDVRKSDIALARLPSLLAKLKHLIDEDETDSP